MFAPIKTLVTAARNNRFVTKAVIVTADKVFHYDLSDELVRAEVGWAAHDQRQLPSTDDILGLVITAKGGISLYRRLFTVFGEGTDYTNPFRLDARLEDVVAFIRDNVAVDFRSDPAALHAALVATYDSTACFSESTSTALAHANIRRQIDELEAAHPELANVKSA